MRNIIGQLNKFSEKIVFVLFCVFTCIVSIHHELWFDELQAWAISKDSLYNILFVLPHYEGHPPLWHLILKCFSFFNVPVEYGTKIPNLLFMFGAVWLLIFKSPFSRPIRLLLPFTYFIFYQYSAISRPYSIFCFALFLAAVLYKTRNENPYRFASTLALLCLSSFFGILFAGGITIAWLIDVLKTVKIKDFFKTKICYSMSALLAFAILLYFIIKPDENVFYYSPVQAINIGYRFLYTFLIAPLDALFMNIFKYTSFNMPKAELLIIYCLLGAFVNVAFLYVLKSYKKISLFVVPFLMFAFFITFVYMYSHHIGLLAIFYIFVLWCVVADRKNSINNIGSKIVNLILIVSLIVQLFWSYSAFINEIRYPYSLSKTVAEFIKKYDLDNYKIAAVWDEKVYHISKSTKQKIYGSPILDEDQRKIFYEKFDKVTEINFNSQNIPVMINAYFDKNVFYSFNVLYPEKNYKYCRKMSDFEIEQTKKIIKEQGLPDILIQDVKLNSIFSEEEIATANYIPFQQFYNYRIWKNSLLKFSYTLYMRQALYEELTGNKLN